MEQYDPEDVSEDLETTFVDEMRKLLKFSTEVYGYHSSGSLIPEGSTNINLSNLVKYKNLYLGTKKNPKGTQSNPDHFNQMVNIYKSCCPEILKAEKITDFQDWFIDQNFSIKINITTKKDKLTYSFPISTIFKHAVKISDSILKEKEKAGDSAESSVLELYPDMFIFHLLNVFMFCTESEGEIEQIQNLIDELQDVLKPTENGDFDTKDPMSDIMGLVNTIAEDNGIRLPKNRGQGPNMKDLKGQVKNILKNPEMKSVMNKMLKGIDLENPGPEDLSEAFKRVANAFQEVAGAEPAGLTEAKKAKASPA